MANANTNIISIDITQSSKSGNAQARSYRGSQHSYSSRHSSTSDFNSALNKANNQINRQSQPAPRAKELPDNEPATVKETVKPDSTDVAAKTPPQGQETQAQDAPQQINPQPDKADTSAEQVPAEQAPTENVTAENSPTENLPAEQVPTENLQNQQQSAENLPAEQIPAETVPVQIDVEIPQNISLVEEVEIPAEVFVPVKVDANITAAQIPVEVDISADIPVADKIDAPLAVETETAEEIPETAELAEIPPVESAPQFFFVSNPESLLQAKNTESTGAVNLMAIMPQSADDKAQSMLDLLSGKTWKSADVQDSIAPQNPQPPNLSPNNFQPAQLTPTQNLELNPQIQQQSQPLIQTNSQEILTTPQNLEQPLQVSTQPQILQSLNQFEQPAQISNPQPTLQPALTLEQNSQTVAQPQNFVAATTLEQPAQFSNQQSQPVVQQNLSAPIELEQPTQIFTQQVQQIATAQPEQSAPIQVQNQPVQFQALTPEQPQQPQFQAAPSPLALNQTPQQKSQIELPPVQQQQFGQQIQPVINSVLPPIDARIFNQSVPQDLLNFDAPVQDNSTSAPLNPVQQNPQPQQQFSQNQPQQQFTAENFQQTLAQIPTAEISQQVDAGEGTFAQNLSSVSNSTPTAQPVAQAQTQTAAAQAPREPFNIPNQIIESARLIRSAENTEMVINLKPEHLGQLTIRVSVAQNGALTANFYSDNAQVRAAIENSIVQLKQELNDQGLKVENVQVYAGLSEGGLTNGQGQQAWQQNQQQSQQSGRRIDFNAIQEEVDAATPVGENASTDGVDYKV